MSEDALSEAEMNALFDDAYIDILVRDNEEEAEHRETYVRGPLYGYMGCKLTSLHHILPRLPYAHVFVDVFGGSGTVTLNRKKSNIEVFNDRHAGVVSFFRTLRDPVQCEHLIEQISLSVYAREEFIKLKDEFYKRDFESDLERAYAWYMLVVMSYAGNARTLQRWLPESTSSRVCRLYERVPHLPAIMERFSRVLVENLDWRTCLRDYDSPQTVFYLDPPYVDSNVYKLKMSRDDHAEMCNIIMSLKGFVMLSGVPNDLYDKFKWDNFHKWELHNESSVWGRYDAIYIKNFKR